MGQEAGMREVAALAADGHAVTLLHILLQGEKPREGASGPAAMKEANKM